MPTIDVKGQSIFYRRYPPREPAGLSCPPLVLIHGAGGTLMNWPPQLRRLEGVTVYAVDLPGHGDSAGNGSQNIAAYRDSVLAFADALTLPRFVAAGHSMGGAIALDMVLNAPARLAGLILLGTSDRLPVSKRLMDELETSFRETVTWLTSILFGHDAQFFIRDAYQRQMLELDLALLHGDFLACDRFDVSTQVHKLDLPTSIICGELDRMTPLTNSEALHAKITGSQLYVISNAGHMVMLEKPDEVAGIIDAFMKQVSIQADKQ